jgi:tungstate transport system ATP-binding protein
MSTQYRLHGFRCGYKGGFVLNVDELVIRRRRLNVLTGPNGCGKSTLLRVLAFLTGPLSGSVDFGDRTVSWSARDLRSLRQRVTIVDQNPYLFRGTVASNVEYGLKVRGIRGQAAGSAVHDALALVSLGGFQERQVRELSGGECRRVALARALALNPEVLLLDEPTANLDTRSADVVERVIAALPEFGTTVVMSTHDRGIGDRLDCDVIRLLDGRIDRAHQPERAHEVEVCRPMMMPAF